MLKNTISSDINLNSVYEIYFLQLFQECVSEWCLQKDTTQQYTKCRSASSDGTVCFNPEIRYGSTNGGFPTLDSQNNILLWCQQLFSNTTTYADATYSKSKSLNVGKGALKWCSTGDELVPKWCDAQDDKWKESTPDKLLSDNCQEDTGIGCIMTSVTCK